MLKFLRPFLMLCATVLIRIAESSVSTMCVLHLGEMELPKELESKEF